MTRRTGGRRCPSAAFLISGFCAALLVQPPAPAQDVDVSLLRQAGARLRSYLNSVPDYICRVDIERFERPGRRGKFKRRDRLKLEVAYVGGRELYGMPGAERLEDGPIDRVTGGRGAMSTGSFAMHLRELFTTGHARAIAAQTVREGDRDRVMLRFDVPRAQSMASIFDGYTRDFVGYTASLRLSPGSLDPEWLQVRFEDVPERIRLASSVETTVYRHLRIGERDISLPAYSELEMETRSGVAMRNKVTFSNCRRYGSEATLRFDDSPAAQPAATTAPLDVPHGVEVTVALDQAIDDRTAIGDTVTATVVNGKGIPPHARVSGHVTRLLRQSLPGSEVRLVGIRLETIEAAGRRGPFRAELVSLADMLTGMLRSPYRVGSEGTDLELLPGESLITVAGRGFPLRVGLKMVWRTQ